MTNNVCICGKSHKVKPIVITVIACKNKHVPKDKNRDLQYHKECVRTATASKITIEKVISRIESQTVLSVEPTEKHFSETTKSIDTHSDTHDSTTDTNYENLFYDTNSKEEIREEVIIHTKEEIQHEDVTETIEVTEKKTYKEVSVNAPSTVALQLPLLSPRYHGPGCALEICVLEKHEEACDYKKAVNEGRNPVDDRVGSYDVIGRIKFKTCLNAKEKVAKSQTLIKTERIETREFRPLPENDPMVMFTFPGDKHSYSLSVVEYKEPVNTEEPNIISESSECACLTYSNNDHEGDRLEICYRNSEDQPNIITSKRSGIEELYFYKKCCNRCVQIDKIRKKKWYHYLMPCLYRYDKCPC